MRTKVLTSLLALVVLALVAGLLSDSARAQRSRSPSDNTNGSSKKNAAPTKHVVVGRGGDTANGSRSTITADDTLKDYSAYRSGDRFVVVLPKSAAGAVARGGGRGYTDVQVQQRGDSVVVSYKLAPGAKAHAEQKFNRLDVVFEDGQPGGASNAGQKNPASNNGQSSGAQNGGNRTGSAGENRNPNASAESAGQASSANSRNNTEAAERNNAAAERAAQQSAAQQNAGAQNGTAPPALNGGQEQGGAQGANGEQGANSEQGSQAASSPAQTPGATPAVESPQVAQNQPQNAIAPITASNPASSSEGAGVSFGTLVLNNWPVALFVGVFVIGLVMFVFARRNSALPPDTLEGPEAATTATLDSEPTAGLEEARSGLKPTAAELSAAPSTATLAEASALAAAPALFEAARVSKEKKAQDEEAAKKEEAAEPSLAQPSAAEPLPAEPSTAEASSAARPSPAEPLPVEPSPAESSAAASLAESAAATSLAESTPAAEAETEEPSAEAPKTEEASVAPVAGEQATAEHAPRVAASATEAAAPVVAETQTEKPSIEAAHTESTRAAGHEAGITSAEALAAGGIVASAIVAAEIAHASKSEPAKSEPAPEVETAAPAAAEAEAHKPSTQIAPVAAHDADAAQAEARRMLDGESYDRAALSTTDAMARQVVAAELLSALAGRNTERRERARAAFNEHGYFDAAARDLREAEAPAERAAAARSLALAGGHEATQHLVAALADPSVDVRRAAVEALATLRDPAAIAPLEALYGSEKLRKNRLPNYLIRSAVESCREAAEQPSAAAPAVEAPAGVAAVAGPEAATESAAISYSPAAESSASETAAVLESATAEHPAPDAEIAPTEAAATEVARTEPLPTAFAPSEFAPAVEVERVEEPSHAAEPPVIAAEPPLIGPEPAEVVAEAAIETPAEVSPAPEESPVEHHVEAAAAAESATVAESVTELAPFVGEPVTEHEAAAPAETEPVAQPALFEDSAAVEAASGVEHPPVGLVEESASAGVAEAAPEAARGAAHEPDWFEFDVHEKRFEPATAEPPAVEPPASVFESSSGEALPAQAGAASTPASVAEAPAPEATSTQIERSPEPAAEEVSLSPVSATEEKGVAPFDDLSTVPASIQQRIASRNATERAAALTELSHVDTDEAFHQICAAFDDEAKEVRSAAARALYELRPDRADSFTRALREASPERRRQIGASIASSGLAAESISQLTGESREKTYEAFSLLFLMAKAGEVQPLVRAIESHPNNEVRLAVVKLLALSGQKEILPAFRRLAVRGSLPTDVRSAVMEAIYQISSSQSGTPSAA
jgi:hypothetical protein